MPLPSPEWLMPASPTMRPGGLIRRRCFTARCWRKTRITPRRCIFSGSSPISAESSTSAIELIERALPELEDLPEAHLNLGNALREAGRLAEAVDSYRRAIALDPDYGMAHSNLARALNDQGLFEAGLESSRRAVALIPDFLGAQVNCAAALMGLERFAEAEAPLRRAVDLAPDRPEAHHDLGEILAHTRSARRGGRRAIAGRWPSIQTYAQAHYSLAQRLQNPAKAQRGYSLL